MPEVAITDVDQSGDIGGNGVSRFHWKTVADAPITPDDCDTVIAALTTFYTAVKPDLPGWISYRIQADTRVIDEASGELVRMSSGSGVPPLMTGGAGANATPAGVGVRLNWVTGHVLNKRLMRGATFLVPLAQGAWGPSGSIASASQSRILTAALKLIDDLQVGGTPMQVYHRPAKGATTGGVAAQIDVVKVGTTPASLRTRRVLA